MKYVYFFIKAYLKKPLVYLAIAGFILVSIFAFSSNDLKSTLPCAVYSLDNSDEAKEVIRYLRDNGMSVPCESEREVYEMVADGKADMGMILDSDFLEKISSEDTSKCARFIVSDRTQRLGTFKLISALAVFKEYMPYRAASMAGDFGYDANKQDIVDRMDYVKEYVNPLSFEVVSIDGAVFEDEVNYNLPIGIISIMIFAIMGFLCTGYIRRTAKDVRIRFKTGTGFFFKCILPQCTTMGMITFVASGAGILIASALFNVPLFSALVSLFIYVFVLIWVFSLLNIIPLSDYLLVCLIAVDAAISLMLCPMYSGTAVLLGAFAKLRVISIPYLLFVLFNLF